MAQADSKDITKVSDALARGDVEGTLEAIGLHRRNFLTGAAAAAAVPALATSSKAAGAVSEPDSELIELGRQLDILQQAYASAIVRYQPFWDEHQRRLRAWVAANPNRPDGDTGKEYLRLYAELGMEEMDAEGAHPDGITALIDPIAKKIMALPALTIAGLSVKARLAKCAEPSLWKASDADADWGDLCVRKFIDAVIHTAAAA
jgi:hypothetical protein